MGMKKQFLKTKPICRVRFELSKEASREAKTASIVGEFNCWDPKVTPMKKSKEGQFSATVDLETGKEFQFRYVLDGTIWENDSEADKYIPSCFHGIENSVVVT